MVRRATHRLRHGAAFICLRSSGGVLCPTFVFLLFTLIASLLSISGRLVGTRRHALGLKAWRVRWQLKTQPDTYRSLFHLLPPSEMSYTTDPYNRAASPYHRASSPYRPPSPYHQPSPNTLAQSLPTSQISAGQITYTTTIGPDGKTVYHPFKYVFHFMHFFSFGSQFKPIELSLQGNLIIDQGVLRVSAHFAILHVVTRPRTVS